jgi:SPP1 gp7 family putative phage head morphogenesis protein
MKRRLRRLTVAKADYILSAPPSRAHERELGRMLAHMVGQIGKRFKSTVINRLLVRDVRKFADAESDYLPPPPEPPPEEENYAELLLLLLLLLFRRSKKQFSDERIEADLGQILGKVQKLNDNVLVSELERVTGATAEQLKPDAPTQAKIDALKVQAVEAVKKIRDNTLEDIKATVLKLAATGETAAEIQKQVDELIVKRVKRAEAAAQNQIDFTNSMITKARAQGLRIAMAIWVTMRDEKVRRTHADRHGYEFTLDKGAWSPLDQKYILPGEEYNCRCVYKLVIPRDI